MTAITLKGEAFDLARSAVATSQTIILEKSQATTDPVERQFWQDRLAKFVALAAQFERAMANDRSQDAEPDEDDEEIDG